MLRTRLAMAVHPAAAANEGSARDAAFRIPQRTRRWVLVGTLLAWCPLALSGPLRGQTPNGNADGHFAVIVHPSTSQDDVALEDLRRLFLGQQPFWSGGQRVVLFVHPAGTAAGDVVLERVYRMSASEYKRYWIGKTFRDEVESGPKVVSSPAMARRLTAAVPGAIAVVPVADVDGTVKVLSIDHRMPGAGEYPLAVGKR